MITAFRPELRKSPTRLDSSLTITVWQIKTAPYCPLADDEGELVLS
jgi:hypothetical protein